MITVVGMGRNVGDVTLDGVEAIRSADVVVVKSKLTHAAQAVGKIRSDAIFCDDLFQEAQDFNQLNQLIISRLQSFGNKKVAFCVVGDGTDDTTAQLLPTARLVCGVGLQSAVLQQVGGSVRIYTAQELCDEHHVLPLPTVVKCIDDQYVAADVQLKLFSAFDSDAKVFFSEGGKVKQIQLSQLLKQNFDYQTTICVLPKKLAEKQVFGFYDAVDILEILCGENGCPWDREQTHRSITKNAIEEAYELVDAIEKEDMERVVEELGDLLMQVLFHIEISRHDGEFDADVVYSGLCRKLVDRHPHVFGNVKAANSAESLDVWNAQKMKEHKIKTLAQNVLDVPHGMSALLRSQKVQSRASKGGYEFENINQVIDKVKEELAEFLSASADNRQMEGGDLLFAVVNLLRLQDVDAETALLLSTEKFCRRIVECERLLSERGQTLKQLNGEQFDQVWNEAKHNVG